MSKGQRWGKSGAEKEQRVSVTLTSCVPVSQTTLCESWSACGFSSITLLERLTLDKAQVSLSTEQLCGKRETYCISVSLLGHSAVSFSLSLNIYLPVFDKHIHTHAVSNGRKLNYACPHFLHNFGKGIFTLASTFGHRRTRKKMCFGVNPQ